MQKLVTLYWGTVFLMYLSQYYYPVDTRRSNRQIENGYFRPCKSDMFMIIVIVWMTCFSFLRTSYNDTNTYIIHFLESESLSEFFERDGFLDLTGNPLHEFYRDLIRSMTDNYHIYFFFPAFLSSFSVIKLLKQFSVRPALSLLIFFSIGTYIMYIAALKQCFAMFILLGALPYAIDKKYIRFYLLVFLAVLFHAHAFMFAVIPFLVGKPWGKRTWLLLGAALFAMATYDATLGAFMNFAQSIGLLVAEIEVFDGHQINILRVLVYWVPALLALVFRRRLFAQSTVTENLFVNCSILSAFILMIGLVEGANLYARMAAYFEIGTAVALPWMINKLFTKQSAKIITFMAGILYFGYFYYEFAISKGFGVGYSAITLWQFVQSLFG